MPRNGSGTYTLPAGNPVVTGTTISSTWANTTLSDIGTSLTNSIAKDGQTVPTANLPMGGYKLTGLGDASETGQAIHYGQIGTLVQAYDVDIPTVSASQAEMEAGTETALRSMSPLRVAQAIASLGTISKTAVATTSGTSVDFTGIPSTAKQISILFHNVSTNGTDYVIAQLGTSSGIETSAYSGSCTQQNDAGATVGVNLTNGFILDAAKNASAQRYGCLVLKKIDVGLWIATCTSGRADIASTTTLGGSKQVTGTLDRVRITTSGGVNTFDAGSVNILYE